jgi:prepilin-type processing-associated H-X9-DG protein
MAMMMYANENRQRLPYQGDYDCDYKGKHYNALPIENSISLAMGYKLINGAYPAVGWLQCPSAMPGGKRHYQIHPRIVPNFQAMGWMAFANSVNGSMKLSDIRRSTEIILAYEATQQLFSEGWNTYGNVDDLTYNLDSSRVFWDSNAFLNVGDPGLDSPLVTYDSTNRDSTSGGDSARGHLRWRHNGNKVLNVVFVDGHVGSFTGRGTSRGAKIANGGDLKRRNFYIDP